MNFLGFTSCQADPNVWMRAATKPNGVDYFEYVLLYVDDCLVISHKPESILREEIGRYFTLKEASIGPPSQYKGGKLRQVTMANSHKCWAFVSTQYVRVPVDNVEEYLGTKGQTLQLKATTPLSSKYRPEVDITDELDEDEA